MVFVKTPDEEGWYWVLEGSGDWWLAHLSLQGDDPSVWVVSASGVRGGIGGGNHTCRQWRFIDKGDQGWHNPEAPGDSFEPQEWHGPIKAPGECSEGEVTLLISGADYRRAAAAGQAVVVLCADFRHAEGERGAGRVTVVGVYGRERAYEMVAGVFDAKG